MWCKVLFVGAAGDRLARSTPIDVLLREDFIIVINDLQFTATVPAGAGM